MVSGSKGLLTLASSGISIRRKGIFVNKYLEKERMDDTIGLVIERKKAYVIYRKSYFIL